ncbi:monocarboxylate transporter 9-like isoform X1 [Penaeus monodon]|uniref:monocarboxylate transporter 9-like isoform X1 n=1 Tax=Penaeus monodon TaxID=6687 RepID=UPI0018A78103|nr:monocarboxylate transporter 9-like isoform X1 [Penaeus monodon]XP_037803297.1 monocarboxylate transporter 9-like isoform X1 [Penaeus monodon]XP_037803298.1 monocarboxylate transporter 9-like isoform X1 [Penaeus monodon]XP_037803299.1 monocarboxylate transporter 9-like isoform X1 [Penaeus monodon]
MQDTSNEGRIARSNESKRGSEEGILKNCDKHEDKEAIPDNDNETQGTNEIDEGTQGKHHQAHITENTQSFSETLEPQESRNTQSSGLEEGPTTAEAASQSTMKPPDGGWGWFVALGSFITTALMFSLPVGFGILFSRFLMDLGTSSTTTAWIFNLQMFFWHVVGPFVRPLTREFGWRRSGFFGVMLISSSIMLSAFAPSAEFLFFSFSLLSGIGGGLAGTICFLIVPTYFERRRGIANTMLTSGICMGQIMGAPFIRYLQDEYAFTGAALIYGAILLNCLVGVSLFHPLKWHLKETNVTENVAPLDGSLPLISSAEKTEEKSVQKVLTEDMKTQARMVRARMLARISESSCTSHTSRGSETSVMYVSMTGIIDVVDFSMQNEAKERSSSLWEILKRVCLSTFSDLRILRSRRALIINTGIALCINSYINFIMMVPFKMQQAGFTLQDSAWCVSILGICNFATRLIISPLADWSKFNMRLCFMIGYAIIASSMYVFPLLTSLTWMAVTMAATGCGIAANITLNSLIMIKYMGIENLPPLFGSSCLLLGGTFIAFGPFIGFVRDMTESYTFSIWLLATMAASSFILWFFMPAAVAYDAKMEAKMEREKERV